MLISPNLGVANVNSANREGFGAAPSKQSELDFSAPQKLVTQTELNRLIVRYVVEYILLLSTVESDSFRAPAAGERRGRSAIQKDIFIYT